MAGIGEASAILGVAQIGIQLAQTLVTVIGDYKDAAVNINRLRDEIHLTSICLQQLGDLAQKDRLLAGRGVLEATNLRERCRSVIWEIRSIIKKGNDPIRPEEINKEEIDVTYFTAWKWALWTKKHLEEPRQELDRLKDSMTLTFVSQMALTAATERERAIYIAQIPGIKRNVDWAEQRYRQNGEIPDVETLVPEDVVQIGPDTWQEFIKFMNRRKSSGDVAIDEEEVNQVPGKVTNLSSLRERLEESGLSKEQITTILQGIDSDNNMILSTLNNTRPVDNEMIQSNPEYQAWSLDPLVGRIHMPVTDSWIQQEIKANRQSTEKLWQTHSKLHAWYKKQLNELIQELNAEMQREWTLFTLKLTGNSIFKRSERSPTLQVILKGEITKKLIKTQTTTYTDVQPITFSNRIQEPQQGYTTYSETIPIDIPDEGENSEETRLTDEEIIQKQLALYTNDQTDG